MSLNILINFLKIQIFVILSTILLFDYSNFVVRIFGYSILLLRDFLRVVRWLAV